MPLYEYRCDACGQPEEKLESLSAPQSHACPAASEPASAPAAESPKSGHGCAAGGCGCPLAG